MSTYYDGHMENNNIIICNILANLQTLENMKLH